MPMTTYPTLLSPLRVGRRELRNRVVMGSMHTRLEHLDDPVRREAAFYAARAAGGAALIVTGGFSPNEAGRLEPGGPIMACPQDAAHLKRIAAAVHEHGALFMLQLLHAGRYAKHDGLVGVSALRSPINPRAPRALTTEEVQATLEDFVRATELARDAGCDGVELMGSEGYLINQFVAPRTNDRTDEWGGSLENRCRFPLELIRRVRARLGPDFLIMYRISAIDLVEGGSSAADIDHLARQAQAAGADILNTGYGWHEAPVPTIAYPVPRAAWAFAAARLKGVVDIPVVVSNRINTPELAEALLADGQADLISMARPLLADPDFVIKVQAGRTQEINTCIACNQSCLDHIFTHRTATCLVNPRAGREVDFASTPAVTPRRIAVVGAGPAGLAAATEAARRGHHVTLFDAAPEVGGQLNLARKVPGKDEFNELLRYFRVQLARTGVTVCLNTPVQAQALQAQGFEHVVVAAGVVPRRPDIPGIDHPKVVGYVDVIEGRVPVGRRVAIIGTGGIGHDVAELLSHTGQTGDSGPATPAEFHAEWGVDTSVAHGGCQPPQPRPSGRAITLFQRTPGRVGDRLGKSTGWIIKNRLRQRGVQTVAGATYHRIDDAGLHFSRSGSDAVERAAVDTVVVCAGQEPERALAAQLTALGMPYTLIGGARLAGELDAARAIEEGTRLALAL